MVSTPVIHVVTWVTNHLPTLEGWKAEWAKLADPQSGNASTIDRTQDRESLSAKVRRPNHRRTPPTTSGTSHSMMEPGRHTSGFLFASRWRLFVETRRQQQQARTSAGAVVPVQVIFELDADLAIGWLLAEERMLQKLVGVGPLQVILHQTHAYEVHELLRPVLMHRYIK